MLSANPISAISCEKILRFEGVAERKKRRKEGRGYEGREGGREGVKEKKG